MGSIGGGRRSWALVALGLVVGFAAPALGFGAGSITGAMIPRQLLLGNPTRSAPAISPDGSYIAYLASEHGVMNVWVAPRGSLGLAKPVTHSHSWPIQAFRWAPDSRRILYLQGHDGDENNQLYGATIANGAVVDYTPFANTNTTLVAASPLVPDSILIALNRRDVHWPDIYKVNLASGHLQLVWTNPGGYISFVADRSLVLRLGETTTAEGGYRLDEFLADGHTRTLMTVSFDDSHTTAVASLAMSRRKLFLLDSRGRDTAALEWMDVVSGTEHLLASDPRVDIASDPNGGEGTLITDPRTGEVLAYGVDYLTEKWVAVGKALAGDISFLDRAAGGQWSVASQSADDRFWTLAVDRPAEPSAYYLFDRGNRALRRLFSTRPQLDGRPLSVMTAIVLHARDGTRLISYLSLPPLTGHRLKHPLPAVILVHGGPTERDVYGYNPYHQWLASRGYAVLSINYRGSTGFGKAFTNSRAWSPQVSDDLLVGVRWLVARGIAVPGRIAIVGGSYGGYLALAGLESGHDAYACGVDAYGPTQLVQLVTGHLSHKSFPPQWSAASEHLVREFGDPRTSAGRAYLQDRSPDTHLNEITRPLLVAQGGNDPRVPRSQSDELVAALERRDVPVTYLVFPDEGHEFSRTTNVLAFAAVEETFLGKCLGGAVEPIDDALNQSSIRVPVGAQRIPGLSAVLVQR